ncbi:hexokinase family protein [Breznakiellaceae bacterium SP9]
MNSNFNPNEIACFARHYGFHYDVCEPQTLVRDLLIDMERGLRGQSSSLPMIPTYISPVESVPAGKKIIALDAGGTNLRAALVSFDDAGTAQSSSLQKVPMPGTQGRLDKEAFFDRIADLVVPLLEQDKEAREIGFCFSYPMLITKDADGILSSFSKEVAAPQVIGAAIGQELREALARRGAPDPKRIVLLNDTVAALLSGLACIPSDGEGGKAVCKYASKSGPMLGFILGTGLNMAYPETSIPKIGFESADRPQLVVCESGNFAHRYMGILDKEYDNTTNNPGAYWTEKVSAGAYLGPLSLHIFKQAVKDGLLRFRNSDELLTWPTLQTKDLNQFLHAPLSGEGVLAALFAPNELGAISSLSYLASIITERGALFAAAVLAAGVIKCDGGSELFAPVRIAVEGTTFRIYKGMRSAIDAQLHTMLVNDKPRFYTMEPVEQASLFGAAVAALSR